MRGDRRYDAAGAAAAAAGGDGVIGSVTSGSVGFCAAGMVVGGLQWRRPTRVRKKDLVGRQSNGGWLSFPSTQPPATRQVSEKYPLRCNGTGCCLPPLCLPFSSFHPAVAPRNHHSFTMERSHCVPRCPNKKLPNKSCARRLCHPHSAARLPSSRASSAFTLVSATASRPCLSRGCDQ